MAQGHFYPQLPTFIGGRQPFAPQLGRPQSGGTQPPPFSFVNQRTIIASWTPAFWPVPLPVEIASLVPAPAAASQPPVPNAQWLNTVIAAHVDRQWTLIYTASIAPILATPPTIDNPPPSTRATLHSIIGQWQRPWLQPPELEGVGGLQSPAIISPPPTISYANLNQIVVQWAPRKWWPLPENTERVPPFVADTTPDQFRFDDQSGVQLSTTITSNTITPTGYDTAANISVVGGTYSINGGAFTAVSGTINPGDTVAVRHTSAATQRTDTDTTLTIDTVSDTFTSTTFGGGGAGRPRRHKRRKYVLRIDGQIFEADSEAQAVDILNQAQALAEKAARTKADAIVERALPKAISLGAVKPIQIKAPAIESSGELQAAADRAREAIARTYANESAVAELRLLMALRKAQDDEEEFLLLH